MKAVLALAIGLATLGFSGTAEAQQGCGAAVLQDWFDGRIDGIYPAKCYREALKQMPDDVRTYTSAAEDIGRALSERLRAAPVAKPSTGQGAAREASRTTSGAGRGAPSSATRAATGARQAPSTAEVLATAGGDRASATPVPLLALAAGLILLAAGAAVWRLRTIARRRAR